MLSATRPLTTLTPSTFRSTFVPKRIISITTPALIFHNNHPNRQPFTTTTTTTTMPEALQQSEVSGQQDPSVTKQWDTTTSTPNKFADLYAIVDKLKTSMLLTHRPSIGPVARSMAIAHRSGPDFLFLANAHSQKLADLASNPSVTVIFQDSSNQDWVSVTGEAVTTSNDDARIKKIYSKPTSAWFGDLGDGVHTGGPEDPRMKLIEVRAKYISYWKHEVGALGFAKEIAGALVTGGVASPGSLRELKEDEIEAARKAEGSLSS